MLGIRMASDIQLESHYAFGKLWRVVEISLGWLQWPTQSAEVNATFAVSPAKPPDFVAVGPAVPARGPGAGGRGARFRAC